VARFAFSDPQRRHVDRLIDGWERDSHLAADSQSAIGRMSSNSSGSTGTKPERR
jgi:hypothetical protein